MMARRALADMAAWARASGVDGERRGCSRVAAATRRLRREPAPERIFRHRHEHGSLSDRGDPRHRPLPGLGRSGGNHPAGTGCRSHAAASARKANERTLAALRRYRAHCESLGVEEIFAVGTSALRDAENSAEVCARFRRELGFDIRVISGAEEAGYSFLAVQRGLSLSEPRLLVIDIGGGSTEFIAGDAGGMSHCASLDLGSVRLTERFFSPIRCKPEEVARMNAAIEETLARLREPDLGDGARRALVGIAATVHDFAGDGKKIGALLSRPGARQPC